MISSPFFLPQLQLGCCVRKRTANFSRHWRYRGNLVNKITSAECFCHFFTIKDIAKPQPAIQRVADKMMGSFTIETSSSSLAQFHSEDCSAALGQVSLHRNWAGNWAVCYWQMCFLSLSSGLTTQVALAASFFNIWMLSPARVGVSVNFKAAGLIFIWIKQTWNMSYGSFSFSNSKKGFAKAGESE